MTTTVSKNLINDAFVLNTGDTITGDLLINFGVEPSLFIQPDTPGGEFGIRLRDLTGNVRGEFVIYEPTGEPAIKRYNTSGSPLLTTSMALQENGLIWVGDGTTTTPVPTTDKNLTNKGYVDDTTVALDGSRIMTGSLQIAGAVDADFKTTSIDTGDVNNEWFNIHSFDHLGIELGRWFTGRQRIGAQIRDTSGVVDSTFYLLPDGNVIATAGVPGSDFPATPSLDVHLANKKYVVDTTVALDGSRTMTGDLVIDKATPTIKLIRSSDTETAFLRFGDIGDGFTAAGYMGIPADDTTELRINSYHGEVILRAGNGTGIFSVGTDGNVAVSAATPAGIDDLTRKDYVDNNFLHDEVFNTSNTSNTNVGDWTKIARVTIDVLYDDYNAKLILLNFGSGLTQPQIQDLYIRVKQQNAFGSDPFVGVSLTSCTGTTGLLPPVVASVIVQNTPNTIVDFYIQNNTSYSEYTGTKITTHDNRGTVEWFTVDGFVASLTGEVQYPMDVLPNTSYVDDTTVALDGSRTMTGDLTLLSGVGTSVYVQPTADSGSYARFVVKDAAGVNRGKMEVVGNTGEMKFDLLNSSSVIINQLYMRTNGNVSLTQAAVPTSDDHLTRKDYVDDATEGYTAQSGNATNTDLDGNPTQTNTLTTNVSLTTSNRVAGRHVDVFYIASGADRTVTLNASWTSFGEASPITVPSGKRLIVTLVALGTDETAVQAVCVLEN